jgi:hypothetical protein
MLSRAGSGSEASFQMVDVDQELGSAQGKPNHQVPPSGVEAATAPVVTSGLGAGSGSGEVLS